jgi:hypothetical protein
MVLGDFYTVLDDFQVAYPFLKKVIADYKKVIAVSPGEIGDVFSSCTTGCFPVIGH